MTYDPNLEIQQDISLKQRLLNNGMWMYILSFIIAPAGYLVKLTVSRELSVEDVGLIYSIIGFIGLLSSFNDLGLTEALQYYLPQYVIDREYVKAKTILAVTWAVQFIGGAFIGVLLYYTAPWMAEHYFHSEGATQLLRYFCIYFLFINLFQVFSSVFTSLQDVKLQYGAEAIRMWTLVFAVFYFLSIDLFTLPIFAGLWIVGVVLGVVVAGILFWRKYRPIFRGIGLSFDSDTLKGQWSYAWKIMIGMQIGTLYSQIGQQFAVSFLGSYEAGIWTNYMTFFTGVSIFTGPIISYLFPLFTELYKKHEYSKLLLMKQYLRWGIMITSGGLAVGGWFLSEWVASVFLSSKFLMSGTMFKRSSLCMFFVISTGVNFNILAGAGYVKQRVTIMFIGTIISLICSFVGVHIWGIRGLMWSLILTYVYFWGHSLRFIKKFQL